MNSPGSGESAGGWVVAMVVIVLVVLFAVFLWPRLPTGDAARPSDGASINVNIPTPTGGTGGEGAGGGTGGTN